MKIIKHGSPPNELMLFKCDYCGCIFELDRSLDKQPVSMNCQIDIVGNHIPPYYTKCPDCGRYADGDYVR